ncbi:hypothetical protein GQR99_21665 (plasmid) [Cereibacter sphaeroides]|nr:hypothetical protein GQR99_21665 [Cereibacter sphaeroides]
MAELLKADSFRLYMDETAAPVLDPRRCGSLPRWVVFCCRHPPRRSACTSG